MSTRAIVPVVVLVMSAAAIAADLPLQVSDVVSGDNAHVRLTNTANQPVTAWSLAVSTPTSGGSHREVYTADGYLSEQTHGIPGSTARLERLMPGESRQIPLDRVPDGATVTAFAVVLDDGTALGDEPTLKAIFARRGRERDALKAVVDAFDDVLPSKHGEAALTALRDRFAALVQRDDALPCRAALDAVEKYHQAKTTPEEIDSSLRTYADFVRKEYDLAAKHATRR